MPALLDRATRDRSVRAALARVDSARLRWLAAANPDWRLPEGPEEEDPAGATSEQDWARLPASARPAVLRRERAADPDHGRELVESSWGTDRARERAALLAVLAEQPHPGDADLLERALDDPSSTVRAAAVAALGRLPGSRRARRMTERLAALVTVHRARGLARLRSALPLVEVARPGEPDESGVRDGLDEPTSGSRTDHWLTQLTAGTPLSWWTEQLGVGPAEVWRAVTEPAVRQGLVEATGLQQDAGWATALWELVDRPPASWLALVPAEQRERHALQRLRADTARSAATAGRRRGTLAARQVGAEALLHVPGPWGEELSRTVLDLLARAEAGTGALPVEVLATRLHPAARAVLTDRVVARETATLVAHVLQYQSASDSIREAFR
nr:DUF5691 domain-containing protein [Auraticoccus cholistanensis]